MNRISDILKETGHSGIVPGMSREDYMAIPRLNPSSLVAGLVGVSEVDPRAIRDAFQGEQSAPTAAQQDRLNRGTLAHLALLQPELLATRVAVWNGGKRQGAEFHGWEDANAGKLQMLNRDYVATMAAVNQMRSQKIVAELLCDVDYEVAVFSTDGDIFTKGQLDVISVPNRTIVDVKTTDAGIDNRSVMRTIATFHYREKMALYREWAARETGTEPDEWRCWNLFLGIGGRVGIRRVKFSTQSLEFGLMRMQQAIKSVRECLESGVWPMFQADDIAEVMPWEMEE